MRRIRPRHIVLGGVVMLLAGFLTDLSLGLPILRSSGSWSTRVLALVVIGMFGLLAEAGAEWINRRDAVSDPLHRRAWHLLLLLTLVAAIGIVMMAVARWIV